MQIKNSPLMLFLLNILKKYNMIKMNEEDLPQYLYYDDMPKEIKNKLIRFDSNSNDWRELFKNTSTGQLWVIDVWDKYTYQIAIKINDPKDWKSEKYEDYSKDLLLQSRGGYGEGECMWMNCNKQRVKGVVYCIDHLYETGARK